MQEFTCFYQTGEHLDSGKEVEPEWESDIEVEERDVGSDVSKDTGDASSHEDGDHSHCLTRCHQVGLSPEQLKKM